MLITLALSANAATLNVGPTQTYTTIGAALAVSNSGDTLSVDPGTYSETLDLRGKNVTLSSVAGPYATTLNLPTTLLVDGGTVEGFTILTAAATAIQATSGTATLRELVIQSPASYGIAIGGGTAIIEECAVYNAGHSGFYATGGSPIFRRSVAIGAAKYGFYLKGGGSVTNSLALGGLYGFVAQTAATSVTHSVALDTTAGGIVTAIATTITNCALSDNPYAVVCNGGEPTFTNGIAWQDYAAKNCASTALSAVDNVDPQFTAWSPGSDLWMIDLHPAAGSPLKDGGTGIDSDGSIADLGIFGGNSGSWRDRDGDGVPVLFDCDDRRDDRYTGATEIEDGEDQDCDGLIDEDVPVDTGGDTGDDTGDDTGGDTGVPDGTEDIDHDGFPAAVDCGDHNVASYPGAPEIMDSVDNDCDGLADEGTAAGDDDADGWSELAGDCDDTDPLRHPQAEETPRDGVDDDCDGTDENPRHQDNDGDGFTDDSDCDDTDPAVYPGAKDPTNGVDDDCDGATDDDDLTDDKDGDGVTPAEGDCADNDPTRNSGAYDVPDDYIDQDCTGEDNYDFDRDGDAAPASGGTDCDDLRSTTFPGAPENCDDSQDNDCDGEVNEECDAAVTDPGDDECGCEAGSPSAGALLLAAAAAGILRRRASNS